MENKEKNSRILLENEGGKKRLLGITAMIGGVVFILFLGSLSLMHFRSDPKEIKEKEEVSQKLSQEAQENGGFTEIKPESKGLSDKEESKNDADSKMLGIFEPEPKEAKEKQPWWLTKDGFVKPRIIKGISAGVISPRGGEAAKQDQAQPQQKLDPAQMEQKTLQALDKMLDQTKNIDYSALLAANAEAQSATGINDGASPAYRQNTNFKGEVYQPASAFYSAFDQSLLLPKSTYIPCSLQTRIVSELKGSIGCIVARDIYSANGQTLLIEKGSQITGSYTNADVTDGSSRLYVIWSEIRTPNNIVIPVDSGGVDPLGGAGIDGYRDNHYAVRFGAAILLSIIDGTIKSLGNYVNSKIAPNSQIYSPAQANELANTALRQTINIKPTIYRNHGDLVGVYVNRDIDFSKVYQLRLRRAK